MVKGRLSLGLESYQIVLAALMLLECLMLTYWKGFLGPYVSPVLLFFVGISIGVLPLIADIKESERSSHTIFNGQKGILMFFAGCFVAVMSIRSIFTDYAIDAKYSDIIPQIQTMVSRLLHGQLPYQIIHFQNYDLFPTYQPLQWLPFTLAEWGHFDYRWIALAIWLLAVGVFVWKAVKIGHPMVYLQTALPFLFFIFIKAKEPTLFAWTMEIMIAGYYLLLALSISSRSIYIIAGGIILCLLSRYSLVFWLPLYFLVLLFSWNRQRTLMAAGLVLIGVLLIYVLPFLSQDAGIFIKGYQYHTGAALGEWQHYDGGTKPHHLFQGIGFACYFFDFAPGNLEQKLSLLKMVHLALSGSVVILLGLLYFFKLRTYLEPRRFLLASLNIYLVVFYSFIQIPYQYLMIVPLFASLPLLLPPAQLATAAAD